VFGDPGVNDADQIVIQRLERNEQQPAAGGKADDHIPAFVFGVTFVEEFDPIGVVKNVRTFIEADSVTLDVSLGLVIVPCKAMTHEATIHTQYTRLNGIELLLRLAK
jgi:hypothetical protein